MKSNNIWKLGITALLTLGICACSSTSASDDDDEEISEYLSSSGKMTKNSSSSGTSTSSSSEDEEEEEINCSEKMAAPSNMAVIRIAPSVWQLSWTYESSEECPETGFVIQNLDISKDAATKWNKIDTTKKSGRNVYHRTLEGTKYFNKLYRVAAYTSSDTGAYSAEVEISRLTSYGEAYTFNTPSIKARVYGDNAPYEFQAIVTDNFPNHSIINSEYTDSLVYQFRWNNEISVTWDSTSISIIESSPYSTTNSRTIKSKSDLCHSYVSARLIWKDSNGVSDSTDWSTPIGPLYNSFEYLPDDPETSKPCQPL